ncbi:transcriptional regulator [Helicobacter didelphidarum]|uniref:Transcriptional regulator n=1 Tax=Helicobacter didelphidarum TaxID=2040648 RepID=A0A3D8IPG9_9HELI|nr:WYL domain-containing protein [Helicobacter didelphidarum]RDU67112.1 transcriptional regulator [Helicobacter didelphidarum]
MKQYNADTNQSHDKALLRNLSILYKLMLGNIMTPQDLADEYSVSLRTIQRDIKRLREIIPIKKEANFISLEYYDINHIHRKYIADFAVFNGLRSLYPQLDNEIPNIINRETQVAYMIKNQAFEDTTQQYDKFDTIRIAILEHNFLSFCYKNKTRKVKPYKLINIQGIWYLLADENNTLKHFVLTKISNDEICEEKFQIRKDIVEEIAKSNLKWFSNKTFMVKLHIANEAREYFMRKEILANKTIISEGKHGIIVSTQIAFEDEILNLVKAWIPYIQILAPHSLRDKLHTILQEYLAQNI